MSSAACSLGSTQYFKSGPCVNDHRLDATWVSRCCESPRHNRHNIEVKVKNSRSSLEEEIASYLE